MKGIVGIPHSRRARNPSAMFDITETDDSPNLIAESEISGEQLTAA